MTRRLQHALNLQGDEKGAWDKPAHANSAHDAAAQTVVHSHSPSILASALATRIAVMHAALPAVMTAPTKAPLSQVTVACHRGCEFACPTR